MTTRRRVLGMAVRGGALPVDAMELSPIKAIELRASRLPDVVSLAQGIPSFDTPEPIKNYVIQKIAEGACAKYSLTPGLPQLRELISEELRRDGMQYDPDGEIIVTCGAIEAVSATLLATVEPGDEVLLASPSYASYIPAVQLAGALPRFVPLNEDANFDLDPDAIGRAITRNTRAILLCNPNHPTGTIYSPAETVLLRQARDTGHRTLNGKSMLVHQAAASFCHCVFRDELAARGLLHDRTYQQVLEIMASQF